MDEDIKKHVLKTGTTTLGIVCKDGIVIAADKRVSYGTQDGGVRYIADRNITKIQEILPNVIATIAGTVSDAFHRIKLIKAEIKLKELRSRKKSTIKEVANLFMNISYQNIRQPSMIPSIAHFVLAGHDESGAHLYDITPDGALKEVFDYISSGSGMMQVNPILDSDYKKEMTTDEGVALAKKCLLASFGRDPGSGEGMDIYVVQRDNIKQVVKTKLIPEFREQ